MSFIALDIETDGLSPVKNNIVALALNSNGEYEEFQDVRGRYCSLEWWSTVVPPERLVLGHNLSFDLAFIKEKYGHEYPVQTWDTMLAERLLVAGKDLQVSLADVVRRRLGITLDKTLQTSFNMTDEITQEQREYALRDVGFLHTLMEQQAEELAADDLTVVWEIEREVMPVFAEIFRRGMGVDLEYLVPLLERTKARRDQLKAQLQLVLTPYVEWKRIESYDAELTELRAWEARLEETEVDLRLEWYECVDLFEWGDEFGDQTIDKKDGLPKGMKRYVRYFTSAKSGCFRDRDPRPKKPALDTEPINLNSSPQLLAALNMLELYPQKHDETETTGRDALKALLPDATDEQRAVLEPLIEYKIAEKVCSSFGDTLINRIDVDGRLRGSIFQIGTDTGRPSSSKPNMLNMPRNEEFRRAFVPQDGYVYVVADYSQMELRIMAEMADETSMIETFISGVDIHRQTAVEMFNKQDITTEQRYVAKTLNFLMQYGGGARKLRGELATEGVKMTLDEAKDAIKRWKSKRARSVRKSQEWGWQGLQQGYTTTALGRKRWFRPPDEDDQYQKWAIMREAANHPIQGTNADITKIAMILIQKHLGERGFVVLNLYDEIVVEVKREFAEWGKHVVETCMVIAGEMVLKKVPVVVDARIGTSWSKNDAIG